MKDYLVLISTDTSLPEEEIIRIYGKRLDIEVFFKVCKSFLRLTKECHSISYDAMTAWNAIVFVRYMMLAIENIMHRDGRSIGTLFYSACDEMSDITWVEAFRLLLETFLEVTADKYLYVCPLLIYQAPARFLYVRKLRSECIWAEH
jgi:hypothetical protein